MAATSEANRTRNKRLPVHVPAEIVDRAAPLIERAGRNLTETARVILLDFARTRADADDDRARKPFDPAAAHDVLPEYVMRKRLRRTKPSHPAPEPVETRHIGIWLTAAEHAALKAALAARAQDPELNHPGTGEKWHANEVVYAGLLLIIHTPRGQPLPFL